MMVDEWVWDVTLAKVSGFQIWRMETRMGKEKNVIRLYKQEIVYSLTQSQSCESLPHAVDSRKGVNVLLISKKKKT